MRKNIIKLFLLVVIICSLFGTVVAQQENGVDVQIGDYDLNLDLYNPAGGWGNVGILSLLSLIAEFAFSFLVVAWVFVAIFAGLKIIRSQGASDQIEGGTKRLKNMLAGITVGLLFFVAISVLGSYAGIGNIFEWSDSLKECSCELTPENRKCYTYKFQAESSVDPTQNPDPLWVCVEGQGWLQMI